MRRPQCESCGKRIYQTPSSFTFKVRGVPSLRQNIPSYCSNCGVEINFEKRNQLSEYDDSILIGLCFGSIIFIIVIFTIFYFLR